MKIVPGERIVNMEDVPCTSTATSRSSSFEKRKFDDAFPESEETKNGEKEQIDDNWCCGICNEDWDDNAYDRWITCAKCEVHFHLECSSFNYTETDYWFIDLDRTNFSCEDCNE